jgi:hypothetical protein
LINVDAVQVVGSRHDLGLTESQPLSFKVQKINDPRVYSRPVQTDLLCSPMLSVAKLLRKKRDGWC